MLFNVLSVHEKRVGVFLSCLECGEESRGKEQQKVFNEVVTSSYNPMFHNQIIS